MAFSEEFAAAAEKAMDGVHKYGEMGDSEMTVSGDLVAVGIKRTDMVRLHELALSEFGPDLMAGGATQSAALLGVLEMVAAMGVYLERARWEEVCSVR